MQTSWGFFKLGVSPGAEPSRSAFEPRQRPPVYGPFFYGAVAVQFQCSNLHLFAVAIEQLNGPVLQYEWLDVNNNR